MTRFEVEAMLKKEKEKASTSSVSLDLKPSYSTEVAAKPYPTEYRVSEFQKYVMTQVASLGGGLWGRD